MAIALPKSRCNATGKRRHSSPDGAVTHLVELAGKSEHWSRRMQVYRCPDCDGWHVGHAPSAFKPAPVIEPKPLRCEFHKCKKTASGTAVTPRGWFKVCDHHAKQLQDRYQTCDGSPRS